MDERLGAGGSSRVYRARSSTGERVALKLLAPDAELDDPRARERLRREVAALASISHPRVVPLLAHGEDAEFGPYLVTPLLVGRTLRELLASWRPSPPAALVMFDALVDATAAVHAAGLVHRDLKPENVMCTEDGRLVLIDLGLALGSGHTRYTEEGAVAGSAPYMSPEQIEGREVTAASDVWALGVMLHELVAGQRPFQRETTREEVAAILAGGPTPLDRVERRAGRALAELVTRCLAPEPGQRFASARELRSALAAERTGGGEPGEATLAALLGEGRVSAEAALVDREVTALGRAARAAAAVGDGFGALRAVDQALAYRPGDPALAALAAELAAPRRRSRRGLVIAAMVLAGGAGTAVAVRGLSERAAAPMDAAAVAVIDATLDAPLDQAPSPGPEPAAISLATWPGIPEAAFPATDAPIDRRLLDETRVHGSAPAPCHARDWPACDEALTSVLAAHPDDVTTLMTRGRLRYRLGKLRSAHADLLRSLHLTGDLAVAHELAHLADYLGRTDDARQLLGAIAAARPDDANAWLDLAQSQPEDLAVSSLDRAAQLAPRAARVVEIRCVMFTYYARANAIEVCRDATKVAPKSAKAWSQLAVGLHRGGDDPGSLAASEHAIALAPEDSVMLANHAVSLAAVGREADALEYYRRACRLGHSNACSRLGQQAR